MNKTLLAYRSFSGVGDWIMAMTVLKMVNQQYPDIDIYLNLKAKNRFAGVSYPILVPELVQEIVKGFDVNIKESFFDPNPQRLAEYYDYCTGHMGYDKDDTNFIEGMVKRFNKNTGLELRYHKDVFAQYQPEGIGYDNTLEDLKPYVLIQACSKMRKRQRFSKDYGFDNMVKISKRLSSYTNVVQVGQKTDWLLPDVPRFLSVELDLLHKLMINSVGFIGMDGGLGVYASHHGVQQYIIYEEAKRFSWTNFPHRRQLNGGAMSPDQISEFIIQELSNEKRIRQDYCSIS